MPLNLPADKSGSLRLSNLPLSWRNGGDYATLCLGQEHGNGVLPPRHWRVAQLYASGSSHKEIAKELGLTPSTVRTYLQHAYVHLGVSNKVGLQNKLQNRSAERMN